MSILLISRHPGAVEWLQQYAPFQPDAVYAHLSLNQVQAGDIVIGTLPIQTAAKIIEKGAQYWHLSIELPQNLRGRELSLAEMKQLPVQLDQFSITRVQSYCPTI